MRSGISIIVILLSIIPGTLNRVSAQKKVPGIEYIDSASLMKTVRVLSGPGMEGRQPGSEGYNQAAAFMAEEFMSLGLKPGGDNGYFQQIPSENVQIVEDPVLQLVDGKKVLRSYTLGPDFVCRGLTGFGEITAPVVFCGYGISEPGAGYDDYEGLDVRGKVVMVFKQNPSWKIGELDFSQKFNRYRANVAEAHGAAGLLLVSTPLSKDPQKPIGSLMDGEGVYNENLPQMHISLEVARELLPQGEIGPGFLQMMIDSLHRPYSFETASNVRMSVKGAYDPNGSSPNVIGILEGSDPVQKENYLVISAHLDHVGKQGRKFYFQGANDNASGSAAVLQIARACVKGKMKCKRSVVFVLYTGEEQGLIGSTYFADHCPVPVKNIKAAFNMDCIGVGDSIQVGCGNAFPELWNKARNIDTQNAGLMIRHTWGGGGADLEALYKKGVPGLYFVSKYSYPHLHLASDTPETLNKHLYLEIVKLVYRMLAQLGNESD